MCVCVCVCLTCVEAQNKRRLKGWRRVKLIQDSNEGDGLLGSSWIICNRDIKDMTLSLILTVGFVPAKGWKVILMWNSKLIRNVGLSHNHFSSGNTTVRSVCIVELHVTVSTISKYVMLHKDAFWRIYVATNDKSCLSLHVKFPVFLSDVDQMWDFMKDFHKCFQYQIWRKSVKW
jgi:hypothetical protein